MLELQGLTRRYGDLVALDDLSFTVAEGQMFGFVGPNGAGKTTAMRIVLGVLEPDAGAVRWRGRPMTDKMRQRLGYLPEDHGQTFSLDSSLVGFRSGRARRSAGNDPSWAALTRVGWARAATNSTRAASEPVVRMALMR
jgi:ABC-type branched-subunit amino acid transport system ATPase component